MSQVIKELIDCLNEFNNDQFLRTDDWDEEYEQSLYNMLGELKLIQKRISTVNFNHAYETQRENMCGVNHDN